MNTTKILDEEIVNKKISSLPARPTSPVAFGGKGYTSSEMRAAFDSLALFIIERFNSLIDDIESSGDGSLADSVPTGISDSHTLRALFSDIRNGNFASYLDVGGTSLMSRLASIEEAINSK